TTLAGLLTLAVNFLAGFAGLGKVADQVRAVIARIRAPIDKALDKVVRWIVTLGRRVVVGAKAGVKRLLQWWRKRRAVGRGDERHSLQFDGDERSARLMVHSAPLTPIVFVSQFSTVKGTDVQRAEVAAAQSEIEKLTAGIVAAQSVALPDEAKVSALDAALTVQFNRLGSALDAILSKAAGEGSEDDPLPIDYPKRRVALYPTIYVGPRSAEPIAQRILKGLPASNAKSALLVQEPFKSHPALGTTATFAAWDGQVRRYTPTGGPSQALPDGNKVGLSPQFASIAPGVKLRYEDKGSTGGGGKINQRFFPFGYRALDDGMDGDHVMERQIGGPDDIANLWPLQKSENRSSGATVKSIEVRYQRKPENVHVARTRRGSAIYLLIRSVRG
ncbi:MAG: HNH endonuclease signature motif containing protein, partial [Rubrivivax sp.]